MAEIKKIVLEIGKKKVELSVEEAKELKEILGELFGKKEIITYPVVQPVIVERRRYWDWSWPYYGDSANVPYGTLSNPTGTITISNTTPDSVPYA